jgi:hypothetical protein
MIATPSVSLAIKGKVAVIYNQQNKAFSFSAGELKKNLEKGGTLLH